MTVCFALTGAELKLLNNPYWGASNAVIACFALTRAEASRCPPYLSSSGTVSFVEFVEFVPNAATVHPVWSVYNAAPKRQDERATSGGK